MSKKRTTGQAICSLPLLSSLLISPLSFAEDMPTIVVTATRIETDIAKSPVPVEIITRQQIENSMAQDVADILENYAGLEVARNGDYGKVTSLFVRGTESNHSVILIDGVKINPATIGSAAIQNISPSIIERIEIVKGPRSSVYGSEAIGGVVNIITRKHVDAAHASVSVGAGEDAARSADIDLAFGKNNFSGGLTLNTFSTDGFPVSESSTQDHGYDNDTVNTFINYSSDIIELNLRHWETSGNVEYYSFGEQNQDFLNRATTLQLDYEILQSLTTSFRASQIRDAIQQRVENFLAQLDHAKTLRNELDLKLDYQFDHQSTVSLGILKAVEKVDALSFGTLIDEKTDIDEIYALYQSILNDHVYAISIRSTDHEGFAQQYTWNADYQYHVDPGVRLYAGIGRAFRAPDNTDRFGFGGNPDLLPETSTNLEFSLIFDLSPSSELKLTAFNNSIDDLIGFDVKAINIDKAEISGIEINFSNRLDNWRFQFNALWQDPRDKTTDEQLSRRAKSRVNTQLSYMRPLWQLSANLSIVSSRDDSSFNDITLPQYELVNLNAYYKPLKRVKVSAKIDNLFNEQYETAAGFNSKDRTFMLELKYNFLE